MENTVADGPNDKYYEASLKVIHLLKQPTKYNPSLPELIRQIVEHDDLGRRFMYRIAQRSYGLLYDFAPWNEVAKQSFQILGEALLKSGIVNIVDDQWASTTPIAKLGEWAKQYRAHWHGRIKECQPDVVVCGGTFDAVKNVLLEQKNTNAASTGMRWFNDPKVDKCIYLDAPHPTARWPVAMVYTYLMVSAKEILRSAGMR